MKSIKECCIPVRMTKELWRRVMRHASLDGMQASVWIRIQLQEVIKRRENEKKNRSI